jgi:hypothetical protein
MKRRYPRTERKPVRHSKAKGKDAVAQLLSQISFASVVLKRDRDQALNIKEFAVLAGLPYSMARALYRKAGFPCLGHLVFWSDFVIWRRLGLKLADAIPVPSAPVPAAPVKRPPITGLPVRAQKILADCK